MKSHKIGQERALGVIVADLSENAYFQGVHEKSGKSSKAGFGCHSSRFIEKCIFLSGLVHVIMLLGSCQPPGCTVLSRDSKQNLSYNGTEDRAAR